MTSESCAKLHTQGLLHMKGLEQALDVSLVQASSCLALLEKKSSDKDESHSAGGNLKENLLTEVMLPLDLEMLTALQSY